MEVWGSAKKVHLSPVMLLQKKIVRTITFAGRLAHTEPIFLKLDILPIDKLIQNRISMFMYKMFYGLHPIGINAMHSQNCAVHSHDTHKKNLHVAIGHSDLYAKRFYSTSISIWNNIMNNINIAVSLLKFNKLLKSYLPCKTLNMLFMVLSF